MKTFTRLAASLALAGILAFGSTTFAAGVQTGKPSGKTTTSAPTTTAATTSAPTQGKGKHKHGKKSKPAATPKTGR